MLLWKRCGRARCRFRRGHAQGKQAVSPPRLWLCHAVVRSRCAALRGRLVMGGLLRARRCVSRCCCAPGGCFLRGGRSGLCSVGVWVVPARAAVQPSVAADAGLVGCFVSCATAPSCGRGATATARLNATVTRRLCAFLGARLSGAVPVSKRPRARQTGRFTAAPVALSRRRATRCAALRGRLVMGGFASG